MNELDSAWIAMNSNIGQQAQLKSSLPPERDVFPPQPEQKLPYPVPHAAIAKRRPRQAAQDISPPPTVPYYKPTSILRNNYQKPPKAYVIYGETSEQLLEQQLLRTIKPSIKGQYDFKKFRFEFAAYIRNDKYLYSQRIGAIEKIIAATRSKYMETITKVRERMTYLQYNANDLNVKLLAQRQKQYVLVLMKSNWKLQYLKEKLAKALYISNLEIKYAYFFRLMRHMTAIERRSKGLHFALKRGFYAFVYAFRQRDNDCVFAIQKANATYQRFGFAVLMYFHTCNRLAEIAETYYQFVLVSGTFCEMKARIQQKIKFRSALLGIQRNDAHDDLVNQFPVVFRKYNEQLVFNLITAIQYFYAVIFSHVVRRKEVVVLSHAARCTCSCDIREIMPDHVCYGCTCGKCGCRMKAPQLKLGDLKEIVVSQKIGVFKIPDVPIKILRTYQRQADRFSLSYHKYLQRELYNLKFSLSCFSQLFYISANPGSPFRISNLSPDVQQLLKQLSVEQVVQMCSNLFLLQKALAYWRLAFKEVRFEANVEVQVVPLFQLKRALQNWKSQRILLREEEDQALARFYAKWLLGRYFSRMRLIAKQLLTPEQQHRADKFFKIVIVSRMIKQWKRLADYTRDRYSNLLILIYLLPEITLLKPAFLKWQALTQIIVENRKRELCLMERTETRLVAAVFHIMQRGARRMRIFRPLLQFAVVYWWTREEYEQNGLLRDCFEEWVNVKNGDTSVKAMGYFYESKLLHRCLQALRCENANCQLVLAFKNRKLEMSARLILLSMRDKNFRLQDFDTYAFRLRSNKLIRQGFYAFLQVFLARTTILHPLLMNDVFYKWRLFARYMWNASQSHKRMLMHVALCGVMRFLDLQRKGVLVLDNHEQLLLCRAFDGMVEVFAQCKQYDQKRDLKLKQIADLHYLRLLREWADGKCGLVSNERLWLGKQFVDDFIDGDRNQVAQELQKYCKLHELQTYFYAFFEWMRYAY